ncbi:MAG TPA: hypothetical protein VM734_31435 [Kofleriaceae bacterium]|nr:hypothetical protein [Kofleriaceae bacterium]
MTTIYVSVLGVALFTALFLSLLGRARRRDMIVLGVLSALSIGWLVALIIGVNDAQEPDAREPCTRDERGFEWCGR